VALRSFLKSSKHCVKFAAATKEEKNRRRRRRRRIRAGIVCICREEGTVGRIGQPLWYMYWFQDNEEHGGSCHPDFMC